jgi:glucosamine-6-phosphate deaminase
VEVIIVASAGDACRLAARIVAATLRRKPDAVLGLPTGATPLPLYAELVRLHRDEGLSFARATTFNLDEYVGIAPEHPLSYHRYMRDALFDHVDLPAASRHLPDGAVPGAEIPGVCDRYEAAIRAAGGIDLQILGLGADGHIGFNEPSSSLASRTRVKTLSDRTRAGSALPGHVITMGVATILDARRCLLLAHGPHKARAVAAMVEGPVTAFVPASALQMHPKTTVIVDDAAAAELALGDYYRSVYRGKPPWQHED